MASEVVVALRHPERFLQDGFRALCAIPEGGIAITPARRAVQASKKRLDEIRAQHQAALNTPFKSIFGGGNTPPRANPPALNQAKAQVQAPAQTPLRVKFLASPDANTPPHHRSPAPLAVGRAPKRAAVKEERPLANQNVEQRHHGAEKNTDHTGRAIPLPKASPKDKVLGKNAQQGRNQVAETPAPKRALQATPAREATAEPELISPDVAGSRRSAWNCVNYSVATSEGSSTAGPIIEPVAAESVSAVPSSQRPALHPINTRTNVPTTARPTAASLKLTGRGSRRVGRQGLQLTRNHKHWLQKLSPKNVVCKAYESVATCAGKAGRTAAAVGSPFKVGGMPDALFQAFKFYRTPERVEY